MMKKKRMKSCFSFGTHTRQEKVELSLIWEPCRVPRYKPLLQERYLIGDLSTEHKLLEKVLNFHLKSITSDVK